MHVSKMTRITPIKNATSFVIYNKIRALPPHVLMAQYLINNENYCENFCHGKKKGATTNALFFCTIMMLPVDGLPAVVVNRRIYAAHKARSM